MPAEVHPSLIALARRGPSDPAALKQLVAAAGVALPDEYLAFLAISDGGEGDVGDRWFEFWPVGRVLEELEGGPHYEGVVLFAGDGANTVYGFNRDDNVVEGDWIGLNRDELIEHGTLIRLVEGVARGQA
jgi:hypothetical protein